MGALIGLLIVGSVVVALGVLVARGPRYTKRASAATPFVNAYNEMFHPGAHDSHFEIEAEAQRVSPAPTPDRDRRRRGTV